MLQELEVPQPREVVIAETEPPVKPTNTEIYSEVQKLVV